LLVTVLMRNGNIAAGGAVNNKNVCKI
jgi:hypothetical protein